MKFLWIEIGTVRGGGETTENLSEKTFIVSHNLGAVIGNRAVMILEDLEICSIIWYKNKIISELKRKSRLRIGGKKAFYLFRKSFIR